MRTFVRLLIVVVFGSVAHSAPRLELLTHATNQIVRPGGSALSGAPEISRDGSNVLFLSLAHNLTPHRASQAVNLYLFNRASNVVSLISVGTNGGPANLDIQDFQESLDHRRIVFESRASNLVPNDTNDAVDVFMRDLELNQTVLISKDINGRAVGGFGATMDATGDRIAFVSASRSLFETPFSANNVFVRFVREARTEHISKITANSSSVPPSASISEDGLFVAFTFDAPAQPFVADLTMGTIRRVTNPGVFSGPPLISADHQFVAFANPNFLGLFDVPAGTLRSIQTNESGTGALRLGAISTNGQTIAFYRPVLPPVEVWRAGAEPANLIAPVINTGPVDLSADGRFMAYMEERLTTSNTSAIGTALYDLQENHEVGLGISGDSPSDPSMNGDASLVALVGKNLLADPDENSQNDIYVWDKSTGLRELISRSLPGEAQVSQRGGGAHAKRGSVSDDGSRVVYKSLEPVDESTKTNRVWNIFLIDRTTGQRQLISRSLDGQEGGNRSSYDAVISGNGRSVAYFTRATNLVENTPTNANGLHIVIKDLVTGAVLLANRPTNSASRTERAGNLAWSRDGRFLIFTSDRLGSSSSFTQNLYLFDVSENSRSLITARTTGAPLQGLGGAFNAAISPDGNQIAFQVISGTELGFTGAGLKTILRARAGGPYKLISTDPNTSPATGGNGWPIVHFNYDSTAVIFGGHSVGMVEYFNLSNQTTNTAATNATEADFSNDLKWSAFTRRDASLNRRHIFLRDLTTGAETFVTTNANHNSYGPQLTVDGRYLIFESRASNLVTNDLNNDIDIFRFDRLENRIEMITRNEAGDAANRASQRPVLSGDTSRVVFKTFASDLVAGDFNEAPDLMAFTLFTAIKIGAIETSAGALRITWQSTAGASYRIQGRLAVETGDWENRTPAIPGLEGSTSIELPLPAGGIQFYRVVQE